MEPKKQGPLAQQVADWERFMRLGDWRRSKKGNLWRVWEGRTVTIWSRDDFYGWSIADCDGPQFSSDRYESVEEAMAALAEELGLGWE